MYQLVFKGQCAPGVEVDVARANVAQVFKANQAQLDRMFSGERVIIRNKLDSDAAGKYQAALAKQGIVVHIEPMSPRADEPARAAATPSRSPGAVPPVQASSGTPAQATPTAPARAAATAQARAVAVEPGERLPVAGERVDQVLAGSSLTLGRVGENLGRPRDVEEPVFGNLGKWSIAPAGERLVEPADAIPAAVPDVSHLDLLPPGERS